jgi:hypothetical protein
MMFHVVHLIQFSLQEIKKHTDPQKHISSTAKPALQYIDIHTPTCKKENQRHKNYNNNNIPQSFLFCIADIHR